MAATTKAEKFVAEEFIRECAEDYAKKNKIDLPKKLKSNQTLFEIVKEGVTAKYDKKKVAAKERYHCETCGKIVQEPDITCWCCGTQLEDGGGWKPKKPAPKKKDDKKTPPKKDEKKPAEKKDDKKPAEKKDDKKPAEKKDDPSKKIHIVDKTGDKKDDKKMLDKPAGDWKLNQYTQEIKRLQGSTGQAAWQIGRRLREVESLKKYSEGKYKNLQEYVEAELSYTWHTAKMFIKAAAAVDEKIAGKVGVFTFQLFARCPQESLPKLIKLALPKPDGKGYNREQLEEWLKEEKERLGKPASGGRPSKDKNVFKKLQGKGVFVRLEDWDEGTSGLTPLEESKTGVEITIRETGVRLDFVELE